MALIDLEQCIAAYDFSASGYSGGKLIDQTAYGNDLTFVDNGSASPAFNTRDGNAVTDFDNTFYYEGKSLLMPGFSIVLTGVVDLPGSIYWIVSDATRKANAGNFDADPYDNGAADFLSNTYRKKSIYFLGQTPRITDISGTNSSGANFTVGASNLITAYVDVSNNVLKASTGTQSFVSSSAFTNDLSVFNSGNFMRIGFLNTTPTGGKYLSLIKAYFFMGDVTQDPDFAQARLDEIASL